VGHGAGLYSCGKSRPTGIRSPDLPAHSESLYRLSHPGDVVINLRIYLRDRFVNYVCTEVYVRQGGGYKRVLQLACP
jgi:hypothetical protein